VKYTIILQLPTGKYHVGVTSDPETYLDDKNKCEGFWSWNRGKCTILRMYKGDFKQKIKSFGTKQFIKLVDSEAELEHFLLDLVC